MDIKFVQKRDGLSCHIKKWLNIYILLSLFFMKGGFTPYFYFRLCCCGHFSPKKELTTLHGAAVMVFYMLHLQKKQSWKGSAFNLFFPISYEKCWCQNSFFRSEVRKVCNYIECIIHSSSMSVKYFSYEEMGSMPSSTNHMFETILPLP